ncbi:MAG: glycosyltransferase [Bacteroidia bacterium]|nr:glycosyltransferase [Bacteroidia bacterium]MBT8309416.1 glycosyltransferase [Bacteroidia bacterium]NND10285.1 glycosyltransferase [Flavobacteriaceae bacterium]NNL60247.1 glycosyltransferase [Flavobacteriaceae bacterium]RZV62414.1 MAG: glycosyltransferase family 4 protein [Flavobacteriaceae bacterium]
MKKLLYITTFINNSGGVAKLLSVKLSYLVQHYDYEIYILNSNSPTSTMFYEFDERIKISSLKQSKNRVLNILKYPGRIKKAIKEIGPDIIVNCDNGLKGTILHNIISTKSSLIYESHISKDFMVESFIDKLKSKLQPLLLSINLKKYSCIVAYDHAKGDFRSQNVKVLHNPLLIKEPESPSALENKIAIAVGRLAYQKGYDTMLQLWKDVIADHPDWKLHIYGEGDIQKYKGLVQELGLHDHVQFFEPRSDIKDVYRNASMLLNTSRYEPFGLAIIEAMAYGLPVFAFKNTLGPSSYIVNNENGFLIEKGQIEDYANTVKNLIGNTMEMKRISVNARKGVKKFNLDAIMKEWHALFQSL